MDVPIFDLASFLMTPGAGRRLLEFKPRQAVFSQGETPGAIYYIIKGRLKLAVVSRKGKEATIALLSEGDFAGEEALRPHAGPCLASATAITACTVSRIEKAEFGRVLSKEPTLAEFFQRFLLARNVRTQADLLDQLFNSSEKRLARILLLMAGFGKEGGPEALIPKISQEALAEMVGTTRSRVSFFMNRFRENGFIAYDRRITVHPSLLELVLHDQAFEDTAVSPPLMHTPKAPVRTGRRRAARRSPEATENAPRSCCNGGQAVQSEAMDLR